MPFPISKSLSGPVTNFHAPLPFSFRLDPVFEKIRVPDQENPFSDSRILEKILAAQGAGDFTDIRFLASAPIFVSNPEAKARLIGILLQLQQDQPSPGAFFILG